jgi:hypothetical protein
LSTARRKKLTVDFGGGDQCSNGGLLLRTAERKLGVCGRLADAMPDRRDASRIRHATLEMAMARVCGMGMSRKVSSRLTAIEEKSKGYNQGTCTADIWKQFTDADSLTWAGSARSARP